MWLVTAIIGFILLSVKILYLIDWADLYSSLQGQRVRESERVTDREREREKRPVRHGEIVLERYGNSIT